MRIKGVFSSPPHARTSTEGDTQDLLLSHINYPFYQIGDKAAKYVEAAFDGRGRSFGSKQQHFHQPAAGTSRFPLISH